MLSPALVLGASLAYLLLLFAGAASGDGRSAGLRLDRSSRLRLPSTV